MNGCTKGSSKEVRNLVNDEDLYSLRLESSLSFFLGFYQLSFFSLFKIPQKFESSRSCRKQSVPCRDVCHDFLHFVCIKKPLHSGCTVSAAIPYSQDPTEGRQLRI